MVDRVDIDAQVLVVGLGVAGLGVARELALALGESGGDGAAVVGIECGARSGEHTSSRNSGVIHAGIYYPTGSLKAALCVAGNPLLYDYCIARGVPHRRCEKLIVATDEAGAAALDGLLDRGQDNGVPGLMRVSGEEARRRVPALAPVTAALLSPTSGIIDPHGLMGALARDAEEAGAWLAMRHTLIGIERDNGDASQPGFVARVRDAQGDLLRIGCRILVNCAGLQSDRVAELAGIDVDAAGYRLRPCIGRYCRVASAEGRAAIGPLDTLVYPVPPTRELVSLGVHATPDLAGEIRFGPDAKYVDEATITVPDPSEMPPPEDGAQWRRFDYAVPDDIVPAFLESARNLFPSLPGDALAPDFAGVRPKLAAPGAPWRDFIITHEDERGMPGLINLIGYESPGLTAVLATARHVHGLIVRDGLLD